MTKPVVRCAIYTRKSSDEGLEQEYNSLDAQRDACAAFIKSQKTEGWLSCNERFEDGGISGATMERPGLKRLLNLIRKSEVKVIVVYKIDRLTRSLADFARIVEILDKHNASFVSVTQQFNTTTSMGRLTLNVLLSFAQFEREVTSERIRDKIAASKKKGMWMGGRPPLGYDVVDRRLVVNKPEAERVRLIFEKALQIKSLTQLENEMRRLSVRAKQWRTQDGRKAGGGPLSRSGLGRMLRNPLYIGKIRQGDKLYEGEHSSLIDLKLWEDVQGMLDNAAVPRVKPGNEMINDAALRDLVFDDRGNRMVPTYVKKKNRIAYRYYTSVPAVRGIKEKAGTIRRINAAYLERIIASALKDDEEGEEGSELDKPPKAKVSRITLYKDEVVIALKSNGEDVPQVIHVPASLKRPSHRKQIFTRGGKNNQNDNLIKAVAQAWSWRRLLENGAYPTVKDLARQKSLSERYVWKILRLAYLSPTLVEAILDGRQPPGLTLRQINETQLSPNWSLQSQALGFESAR